MPRHKSAVKRVRQTERRRQRNVQQRSQLKTAIKKMKNAENPETAEKEYKNTAALLDSCAARGIIHRNKAANLKSSLSRLLKKKA